jgi:hypothetical protein
MKLTQKEIERLPKDLDSIMVEFAKEKRQHKLKEAVRCSLISFQKAKLNYNGNKKDFYRNMNYSQHLTYNYLQYLHHSEMWDFTEEELTYFNN